MRKAYCLFTVAFVGIYLVTGRNLWFAELERQARIGSHPVFSPVVNLDQTGEFVWKVPREQWQFETSDAQLSLVLDRTSTFQNLPDRSTLKLRATIAAYTVSQGGDRNDCLIRNWYYTTEPFSPGAQLWTSFGSEGIEYGLAGIHVYPSEDLFVSITVTTPQPDLQSGNPRLKLVGEHDYAVFEHLPVLRLFRDGGLALSLLLLVGLTFLAWRGNGRGSREA
jgi:hypothetical protein